MFNNVESTTYLNLIRAKNAAITALPNLNRNPDKYGNYPYLLISFSNYNRIHIYRCPVFESQIIIRETRDLCDPFISRIISIDKNFVENYIWNIDAIVYVAVTELETELDTMKILYEEES